MVGPGRGQSRGVPGHQGWVDEGVGESEVNGAGSKGAREGEPGVDTRGVEEGVDQVGGRVEIGCRGFLLRAGDDP